MKSRSVHRALYNVRVSFTIHLSCHALIAMIALYLLFLPPLSYCPVVPTTDADAPVIDYFVDDRTPTIKLPGKQSHSPLPHIAYLSVFICCTRHMLLLRYFPISHA